MDSFDYELWVDRGGTFTDCVLVSRRDGRVSTTKVLSTHDAPVVALRALLPPEVSSPAVDLRIGTTLGTNALLERRGASVLLVTDAGLGDLLRIRDQARPDLFARTVIRPEPLTDRVIEVDARIGADGAVHGVVDEARLLRELDSARRDGFESVAVALRFSPLEPAFELRIEALARDAGFVDVVLSHRVVPEPGFLARLETTVVDAYLTPVLQRYFAHLAAALPGSRIRAMQSDGSVAPAAEFRGRDAALSGPAGGLVAASRVVRNLGIDHALAFDMGGTSTDVSRVVGEPRPSSEGTVAGLRIRAPMLAVHTVAAGGGSLCRVDVGRLVVGPESAGAFPGPLCYGRAEATELALTDVALCLGRIVPDHFPFALDVERPRHRLTELASELPESSPLREPLALAEGFFEVAVSTMARALEDVSIAEGYDPREHALVVFGGAGGQYACSVARRIGIRTLVFHPLAGVLSAYGIGVAPLGAHRERELGNRELGEPALMRARLVARELEHDTHEALRAAGGAERDIRVEAFVVLRYRGTDTTIEVPLAVGDSSVLGAFEERHRRLFGMTRGGAVIEMVAARVYGRCERDLPSLVLEPEPARGARTTPLRWEGRTLLVPCVSRSALEPGAEIEGPLVVLEGGGTVVVEPGFRCRLRTDGVLVLTDGAGAAARPRSTLRDPVRLEVMGHLFASIATRMGHVLQKTASSPNIRDRLDFSCAIFDRDGGLVANAPHIPVHLGAMGDSVRSVLAAHRDLRPGDAYLTNDPCSGGSHLPDVTVVSPVFDSEGTLRLFVANRGHHADVGGRVPGSMPAFSSSLEEEGVVFRGVRIVRDAVFDEEGVRALLTAGPRPARNPDENLRDLRAQLAANRAGAQLLGDAFAEHGVEVVVAYVGYLQQSAEERVRAALRELPFRGRRRFEDSLDDGSPVVVTVELHDDGTLDVDFEGTAPPHPGNANAPSAVVRSAVLYVLRMLVGRPMPLNEGCLRAVRLRLPEPSLVAPPPGAAVSSGNVETSQRIVDVLVGALGLSAASQGTMNNVVIGNERFAYYETLGGGAGATRYGSGASAVHTHMTNSRLTDVEILESSFPIRIVRTAIRRGSGGEGERRGGDGMIREYELLEDALVSVVSERRVRAPFGELGGGPGRMGENTIDGVRAGGRFERPLRAGQRMRIETPGGGGSGATS